MGSLIPVNAASRLIAEHYDRLLDLLRERLGSPDLMRVYRERGFDAYTAEYNRVVNETFNEVELELRRQLREIEVEGSA